MIRLLEAAQALPAYWHPRVVGRVNDHFVKVAKLKGSLAWHRHEHEDELFLVLRGRLRIEYEGEAAVELTAGDIHVVPKGVLHNPVCEDECLIALVEPVATKHTGDLETDRTVSIADQLGEPEE